MYGFSAISELPYAALQVLEAEAAPVWAGFLVSSFRQSSITSTPTPVLAHFGASPTRTGALQQTPPVPSVGLGA